MIIYVTKFTKQKSSSSKLDSVEDNSTDGYHINNKDDIKLIKEENFLIGIFIPSDENCSYDELLYTYDFKLFINKINNDEWKPLEKKELDHSNIIVTKRKNITINNSTSYYGQVFDNSDKKHGYGEINKNNSIIRCHWCHNRLNYKQGISLELDNKIKIKIYENGIINCTIDHPHFDKHCNKFNEWSLYTNYYSNINNKKKLIKFVLDILINDKYSEEYNFYKKVLFNSPIEYLIYFKSFYGNCFLGYNKNKDDNKINRLNLLGYLLFNLEYINKSYSFYYKYEDCKFCKSKTNSSSTCLTYRHENDPDQDYINKHKKEWIKMWNESDLTFNIDELFKKNHKERRTPERSPYRTPPRSPKRSTRNFSNLPKFDLDSPPQEKRHFLRKSNFERSVSDSFNEITKEVDNEKDFLNTINELQKTILKLHDKIISLQEINSDKDKKIQELQENIIKKQDENQKKNEQLQNIIVELRLKKLNYKTQIASFRGQQIEFINGSQIN